YFVLWGLVVFIIGLTYFAGGKDSQRAARSASPANFCRHSKVPSLPPFPWRRADAFGSRSRSLSSQFVPARTLHSGWRNAAVVLLRSKPSLRSGTTVEDLAAHKGSGWANAKRLPSVKRARVPAKLGGQFFFG